MNFYQNLGYLILGSRLRRLSEYYLAEINRVYAEQGIDFDASWFPVFYLLSEHQPISNQELADAMLVSHSAASQLVTSLRKKGLVKTIPHKEDGRRLDIGLTPSGEALLQQLLPIWKAIDAAMLQRLSTAEEANQLLQTLTAAEAALQTQPLSETILQNLHHEKNI